MEEKVLSFVKVSPLVLRSAVGGSVTSESKSPLFDGLLFFTRKVDFLVWTTVDYLKKELTPSWFDRPTRTRGDLLLYLGPSLTGEWEWFFWNTLFRGYELPARFKSSFCSFFFCSFCIIFFSIFRHLSTDYPLLSELSSKDYFLCTSCGDIVSDSYWYIFSVYYYSRAISSLIFSSYIFFVCLFWYIIYAFSFISFCCCFSKSSWQKFCKFISGIFNISFGDCGIWGSFCAVGCWICVFCFGMSTLKLLWL